MTPAVYTGALVGVACVAGVAVGQSQPTPGAPSQPFAAVAQAQNGGAGPQVTYQYGMEFVTIRGGTETYPGGHPNDVMGLSPGVGRGAVAQDYRISRYEVGAASWNAFYQAVGIVEAQTGQQIPHITRGGGLNGNGPLGRVGNISWRTAAIYCNWLHNNQTLTRDAFMSGAYDVSTFAFTGADRYTDQLTRSPGARFFVPSLDEWIRASHFDPNRHGEGQGGWWQFGNSRDTFSGPGLPGQAAAFPFQHLPGEANYGFSTSGLAEFRVPLGAYSTIQSPWGLFDVSGASGEWIEEPFYALGGPGTSLPTGRYLAGTYLTSSPAITAGIGTVGGQSDPSDAAYWMGFRVAAVVPTPGVGVSLLASGVIWASRRRVRAV